MHITRSHTLGTEEVKRRIDAVADSLSAKYGVKADWQGDDMKLSGTGVNGNIAVKDDSLDVDLKLGFALKMLESTIKSSIEEALDKHLE